jgi:hypothetical protein
LLDYLRVAAQDRFVPGDHRDDPTREIGPAIGYSAYSADAQAYRALADDERVLPGFIFAASTANQRCP